MGNDQLNQLKFNKYFILANLYYRIVQKALVLSEGQGNLGRPPQALSGFNMR